MAEDKTVAEGAEDKANEVQATIDKSTAPDDASAQEQFQTGAQVQATEAADAANDATEALVEAQGEKSAQDQAVAGAEVSGGEVAIGIDGENPVSFWNPSPKALAQHERRVLRADESAERDDADSRSEAAKTAKTTRTRNANAAAPATPAKKA